MKKTTIVITALLAILILGCINQKPTVKEGIEISVNLTLYKLARGADTTLQAVVTNYLDQSLYDVQAGIVKYVSSDITIPEENPQTIPEIRPKVPVRFYWTLHVTENAQENSEYNQNVRVCFNYTTISYHDLLITPLTSNASIEKGQNVAPISLEFIGLEDAKSTKSLRSIPFTIVLSNKYKGRPTSLGFNLLDDKIREFNIEIPSNDLFDAQASPALQSQWDFTCTKNEGTKVFYCKNGIPIQLLLYGESYEARLPFTLNNLKQASSDVVLRIKANTTYTYCFDSPQITFQVIKG
ncbi:MAG: hypothetical protein OH319_03765 [Candidatus Parvarchaeota archaeon]|nr:hypothetical protein [Candidatus Jingweiarchaeum tengchongense]MCW1298598.1 hypothetical protein [Candidatus Jingweiarchaeum tengchongense]MCW1309864.1 hypothetical protein [Candidatus Jingweiarchaeum tengchongense]